MPFPLRRIFSRKRRSMVDFDMDNAIYQEDWEAASRLLLQNSSPWKFWLVAKAIVKYKRNAMQKRFLTLLLDVYQKCSDIVSKELLLTLLLELPFLNRDEKDPFVSKSYFERKLNRIRSMPADNYRRFEAIVLDYQTRNTYWGYIRRNAVWDVIYG